MQTVQEFIRSRPTPCSGWGRDSLWEPLAAAPQLWRVLFNCAGKTCTYCDNCTHAVCRLEVLEECLDVGLATFVVSLRVTREDEFVVLAETSVLAELLLSPQLYLTSCCLQNIGVSKYMRILKKLAGYARDQSIPGYWDMHGRFYVANPADDIDADSPPFADVGRLSIISPLYLSVFVHVWRAQGLDTMGLYKQYPVGCRGSSGHFLADVFLSSTGHGELDFSLQAHCMYAPALSIPDWVMKTHHYSFSCPQRQAQIAEWNDRVLVVRILPRLLPVALQKHCSALVQFLRASLLHPVIRARQLCVTEQHGSRHHANCAVSEK